MEVLVAEEVEQQLHQLPSRVLKYVKALEVETYALNRLPCLYAASEQGWRMQVHKARHELGPQIRRAVRQAIAAVQVDPLRSAQPLQISSPASSGQNEADELLEQFRQALGKPTLTWDSLLRKCQRARKSKGSATAAQPRPSHLTSASGTDPSGQHSVRQPGTYGGTAAAHRRRQPSPAASSGAVFDWSDSRYL